MNLLALIDPLAVACREAGDAIRAVRSRGFQVQQKGDYSPVTEADRAAEAILLAALGRYVPGVPVVAEEEAAAGRVPALGDRYFLVDPLDGTKEFVRGGDDYTVNVGLIVDGRPVLGIVFAPERSSHWWGVVGEGAWIEDDAGQRAIGVSRPGKVERVVASKSHMNGATLAYLAAVAPAAEMVSVGSSLKFCLVAEGKADLYPRTSPTCEWDTAAGHAVLLAAGGQVVDEGGRSLGYGKPNFLNGGFVASGGRDVPTLRAVLGKRSAEPGSE